MKEEAKNNKPSLCNKNEFWLTFQKTNASYQVSNFGRVRKIKMTKFIQTGDATKYIEILPTKLYKGKKDTFYHGVELTDNKSVSCVDVGKLMFQVFLNIRLKESEEIYFHNNDMKDMNFGNLFFIQNNSIIDITDTDREIIYRRPHYVQYDGNGEIVNNFSSAKAISKNIDIPLAEVEKVPYGHNNYCIGKTFVLLNFNVSPKKSVLIQEICRHIKNMDLDMQYQIFNHEGKLVKTQKTIYDVSRWLNMPLETIEKYISNKINFMGYKIVAKGN